jgi:hypothetical protein
MYPYWLDADAATVQRVGLFARSAAAAPPATLDVWGTGDVTDAAAEPDTLAAIDTLGGMLVGAFDKLPLPASPIGTLRLYLDDRELEDLWVAVTWGA